ncbi:uncharacterized protein LOC115605337 [Strigops habroptila]|uniref:uncharacterized protein LOC115605337 n=1 Tax=Strigops habroptila TaxID=2489341 RepID=UPI0011D026A8|nr:uncharacterized protein LOC115605337 [Strigops habroptila]
MQKVATLALGVGEEVEVLLCGGAVTTYHGLAADVRVPNISGGLRRGAPQRGQGRGSGRLQCRVWAARGSRATEALTCCATTARGRSRGSGGPAAGSAGPGRCAAARRGADGAGITSSESGAGAGRSLPGRAAKLVQELSEPFVCLLTVQRLSGTGRGGKRPFGSRDPAASASAPCAGRLSLRRPEQRNKAGASAGGEGAPGRERCPAEETLVLPCLHLPTAGDLVGTPLSSDLRIGRDPLCRERHLAWIYSLREEAGLPAVWSNLLVTAMYLYTCLREHVLWTDTPACYSSVSGNFRSSLLKLQLWFQLQLHDALLMDTPVRFNSGYEMLLLHAAVAEEVKLLLVTSFGLINAPSCYQPVKAPANCSSLSFWPGCKSITVITCI